MVFEKIFLLEILEKHGQNYIKKRSVIVVTSKERSALEQMLFIYSQSNDDLRRAVQKVYDDCTRINECREWSDVKFGMRYCKLILDNQSKKCPDFRTIAKQVDEPVSTYYFYRKEILDKIQKEIEKG